MSSISAKPPSSKLARPSAGLAKSSKSNSSSLSSVGPSEESHCHNHHQVTSSTEVCAADPVCHEDSSAPIVQMADTSGILTENTDDFIIGNRVWVGGTKPGYIQYIGETQFAPGEWAGVVLEESIGKNDGSVAGVRYFQCEPKRGVFSRLNKLTREPVPSLMRAEGLDLPSDDGASWKANGSVRSTSPRLCSTSRPATRSSTPSSLHGDTAAKNLKVGDRVLVTSTSGVKTGTLRYLGTTEFAVGEWAGVELDDAGGKNDGSVAGRRYFDCTMKYGLFAPVHKVSKVGSGGGGSALLHSPAVASSSSATTPPRRVSAVPKRVGSHESISTIGSATSSIRASKPRLGINALTTTGQNPSRTSTASVTATHSAMQGALKGKEQHIEQLMKERDMERAEVVRAAAQVDEAERKLGTLKNEHEKYKEDTERNLLKAKERAEAAEKQLSEVQLLLEEERKKNEDLQFRVEEESIIQGDLEQVAQKSQTMKEVDTQKIRQLEELLRMETVRADKLEQESHLNFQGEEMLAKHLDEIDNLKEKLRQAEETLKTLEAVKIAEKSRSSLVESDLVTKSARLSELEMAVQSAEKMAAETTKRLGSVEEVLAKNERSISEKEATITEQQSKMAASEDVILKLTKRTEELQILNSDLERSLRGADERVEGIIKLKEKLEAEISEHMKSSGDSSVQLVRLNDDLRQKEREVETLRQQLQSQKQEGLRLEDIQEQTVAQHRREIEGLGTKHWKEVSSLEERIRTSSEEIDRLRKRFHDQAEENAAALEAMKQQHRTQLDETLNQAEENGRQMQLMVVQLEEALRAGDEGQKAVETLRAELEKQLARAQSERDAILKEKEAMAAMCASLKSANSELQKRVQHLENVEQGHTQASSAQEERFNVLNAEASRLKAELEFHRADLQRKLEETFIDQSAMQDMKNFQELQQAEIVGMGEQLTKAEEEQTHLRSQLAEAAIVAAAKNELEQKVSKLEQLLEETRSREPQLQANFENERETLQKMLETTQMLLEQKEKELDKWQAKVTTATSSSTGFQEEVKSLQQQNLRLENERTALELKVVQLLDELARSKAKENVATGDQSDDAALQKLIEEKEAAEAQVDFLNSVIVDMQRKNDDLSARVQVLEMRNTLNDSSDVNLNIKGAVPPRLFCDICEVFDLHDTEDCPKQMSDDPPATQYHGSRHQERPYCDLCEVFGHWTNECDDNETF